MTNLATERLKKVKKTFGLKQMSEQLEDNYPQFTQEEIIAIPKLFCSEIAKALLSGRKVRIERVCCIDTKKIKSRCCMNPKTGERFIGKQRVGLKLITSRNLFLALQRASEKLLS